MIKSVQNKTLCVAVLLSVLPVFGQTDNGIVRLDLKEFPHDSPDSGPPETMPVYVEIATVQPDVEQGIVFTLNIENNSTETIRIIDPIDTARISVFGHTNPASKSLRNIDPDFALCISRPARQEQVKARSDDKKTRRPFQAFDTYDARRDRRLNTVSDIVPWEPPQNQPASTPRRAIPLSKTELFESTFGGKLTLEPGQRFQAMFQISRLHANYEAYEKSYDQWLSDYCVPNDQGFCNPAEGAPPKPVKEIIPIPSGKYSLRVSIILVTDYAKTFTPSFDKRVTIQLGEPDISKPKDAVIP